MKTVAPRFLLFVIHFIFSSYVHNLGRGKGKNSATLYCMNMITARERLNALTILCALGIIAILIMPEGPAPQAPISPDANVTVRGTLTCLPHKDQSGPTTLECMSGIRAENGDYYALDLTAVSAETMEYDYSGTVTVSGHLTPAMALSSSQWYQYEMLGIISVETLQN